eukprot:6047216-Pleurochrysis_carterae.AAC.1
MRLLQDSPRAATEPLRGESWPAQRKQVCTRGGCQRVLVRACDAAVTGCVCARACRAAAKVVKVAGRRAPVLPRRGGTRQTPSAARRCRGLGRTGSCQGRGTTPDGATTKSMNRKPTTRI